MNERLRPGHASRVFCFAVFAFLPIGTLLAQPQAGPPPNIEILKLKWEKQVRLPRNFDPAIIPEGPGFTDPTIRTSTSAPVTGQEATRVATSNQSTAAIRSSTEFPASPRRLPTFYVYSLKVKNTGATTIEGVAWDYVFTDANSNVELGRHQFLSYQKIDTNRTANFHRELRSPPTQVVRVSESKKKPVRPTERAVIQCILYADNTTWRNPQAPIDSCTMLANGHEILKRKRAATRLS